MNNTDMVCTLKWLTDWPNQCYSLTTKPPLPLFTYLFFDSFNSYLSRTFYHQELLSTESRNDTAELEGSLVTIFSSSP